MNGRAGHIKRVPRANGLTLRGMSALERMVGTRRIGRALLGVGQDGLQGALDRHGIWKRFFKKALTSWWDLFAAASW